MIDLAQRQYRTADEPWRLRNCWLLIGTVSLAGWALVYIAIGG